MMNASKDELFAFMKSVNSIKFGNFTLKSGITSTIYCDMRPVILDPRGLKLAVECLRETMKDFAYDSLGVIEGAASSVLLGGMLRETSGFVIRKEGHGHGTGRHVEGKVGEAPILIDDVATTGGSIWQGIFHMIRKPIACAVLVDRQEGAKEILGMCGIPLLSVFTLRELNSRGWQA